MRAKSQTALPELAGEKRPRQKCVFGVGFLVLRNRSVIHVFLGGLAISPDVLDAETAEICMEQIVAAQRSEV